MIRKDTLFFESTHQRGGAKSAFGLLGSECGPKIGVVVERGEGGLKAWIAVKWRRGVVGTAALTLVAAENPSVGVEGLLRGLLNCPI